MATISSIFVLHLSIYGIVREHCDSSYLHSQRECAKLFHGSVIQSSCGYASKPSWGDCTPASLKAVQVALVELVDYLQCLFILASRVQKLPASCSLWTGGKFSTSSTTPALPEKYQSVYPSFFRPGGHAANTDHRGVYES